MTTSEILLVAAALIAAPAPPGADDAERVDALLERAWEGLDLRPAGPCSDETFLRRVTLDLAGRIPTRAELDAFRADPNRPALVERLLDGPEFPRFWSEVWTDVLVGRLGDDDGDLDVENLRQWLETAFRDATPFDRVASALISAEGETARDAPVNFVVRHLEEPAVKVSRVFLGVRLECARCHDHPFDRWKRTDFESFRRFFDNVEREELSRGNARIRDAHPGDVPRDERPRFLNGAVPVSGRWRAELAMHVTRSKPFARAFANRIWYHFMGRGLVHPVDDFHAGNPPVAPELLEFLAERAREDRFDLRASIRRVVLSRAYARSSAAPDRAASDDRRLAEELFAVRALKPLTPAQRFDSLAVALGRKPSPAERARALDDENDPALELDLAETWIDRASTRVLLDRLAGPLDAPPEPELDLDEIFRRLLSRDPSPRERELCAGRNPAEILFALVHSHEFAFNH